MHSVKIHDLQGQKILAACDIDLLGKSFDDGSQSLHLSENFYEGMQEDTGKYLKLLSQASCANLFGEKTVDAAVKEGIIDESQVITFCGIKHAQLYLI